MSFTYPTLTLPDRKTVTIPEDFRCHRIREGRKVVEITLLAEVRQPLVINYGLGTDSTALLVLLVEMYKGGNIDARPDRIMFADVGSEKINTYSFLQPMQDYLAAAGFPAITVVSKGERGASKDLSLHESCLRLNTMPSLAYGGKSCSLKWKAAEMDFCHARWEQAQNAWAAGLTVIKAIGYDASPADLRRCKNPGDSQYTYWYPLRDARLTRPQLIEIITAAGLPLPGKSACFCCPASKPAEVIHLAETDPAQCALALKLEALALLKTVQEGRAMTTVGLGRRWSWRAKLAEMAPALLAQVEAAHDTARTSWDLYRSLAAPVAAADLPEAVEIETCDDVAE